MALGIDVSHYTGKRDWSCLAKLGIEFAFIKASEGATVKDDINSKDRLMTPKVRRPGSDHWEDISWDDAIAQIARHVKDTRDRCFVAKNAKGQLVNRTPGIAMIGGCTDTTEFNWLQWKTITALGVPYRDSQARV